MTLEGHTLKRASADCWLCQCGKAIFGCTNDRDATRTHGLHLEEIKKHRAAIAQEQKDRRQATFMEEPSPFSPYRKGATSR